MFDFLNSLTLKESKAGGCNNVGEDNASLHQDESIPEFNSYKIKALGFLLCDLSD